MQTTIFHCSACGEKDHANLEISELALPLELDGDTYTHYVVCPKTNEVVYIRFTGKENTDGRI